MSLLDLLSPESSNETTIGVTAGSDLLSCPPIVPTVNRPQRNAITTAAKANPKRALWPVMRGARCCTGTGSFRIVTISASSLTSR